MRRLSILALGLLWSTVASAATDVFVAIPGIPGSSTDMAFPNTIEPLSVDVSQFRVAEIGAVDAAGAPKLSELKITKLVDTASPLLFEASLVGAPLTSDTVISFRRAGGVSGTSVPYLTLRLSRVLVTGYSLSTQGDDNPTETVTLAYDSICLAYQRFNSQGNPQGSPVERCFTAGN
ncbi:MAG: type VI secretion system tube protein Hcp [Myxococcota bacterium]